MANDQPTERWSRQAPVPPPEGLAIHTAPDGRNGQSVGDGRNQGVRQETVERPGQAGSSAGQEEMLNQWRGRADAIATYNSRQDGGHLQDAVYRYGIERIRALGLDKEGWELLPSQMGSPLDLIGCDLVLHNRRTGAMEMLDPTSMRLNRQTGERSSASENGYSEAPRIREAGVIDALPTWFDASGALRRDHEVPQMRAKVEEFAEDFDARLKELTRPGQNYAFNMKEFPLPSPVIQQDKSQSIADLKQVVDWSKQKAEAARRAGDRSEMGLYGEFAQTIEKGALAFSSRIDAKPLQGSVEKMAERVILEDVIKSMRPHPPVPGEVPPSTALRQSTQDGSSVQIRPDGTMIMNLRSADNPGQTEIYNGGNVFDAFNRAAKRLSAAVNNKEVQAELVNSLPKSQRKLFESGQLSMEKVLRVVERFRNEYGAGGAGQDRTLAGILVHKYAQRTTSDLKSVATGSSQNGTPTAAPNEGAVGEQERLAARETTGKTVSPVLEVPPLKQETSVKPAGNGTARPTDSGQGDGAVKGQVTSKPTSARRESLQGFSELGAKWAQRQNQGKTEVESGKEQTVDAPPKAPPKPAEGGKWTQREAPTPDRITTAKPGTFVPLTAKEVQRLDEIRAAIAKKGQLSTDDQEILRTIDRAKSELTKPAEGDAAPHLAARVNSVRKALGMEGVGSLAGLAIISGVMLQVYRDQQGRDDGRRAVFGQSW